MMLTVMMTMMKHDLEDIQFEDGKMTRMWVLVFYGQQKLPGNVLEK